MTAPGLAEVEDWVARTVAEVQRQGVVDISEVEAHPTRDVVVCTLGRRTTDGGELVRQLALVEVDTARCHPIDLGPASSGNGCWSPDGARLAVVATPTGGVPSAWVVDLALDDDVVASVQHRFEDAHGGEGVRGAVEAVSWSPRGDRLLVLVAEFGAEVSDVHGSGTVRAPEHVESWRPTVSPGAGGRRRLLEVWEPGGSVEQTTGLNVWEAAWSGPDHVVALVSEDAGEGAWYAAELLRIGLHGTAERLHRSSVQMSDPQSDASGVRWSVIESRASDRGLLAGHLVVGGERGLGRRVATAGVDVTAQRWIGAESIAFAGIRGLDTVFGIVDLADGTVIEQLATDRASGLHQPEAGALTGSGELLVVLESHDHPPALIAVADGCERELVTTNRTTPRGVTGTGTTSPWTWKSSDGQEIQGLLTLPAGDGPHPLVVNIHGGPVAAWRDGWMGKDLYAHLLCARGFAVLRPNPRGSAGRGQAFIEAVVGDMGGADGEDIRSGVSSLIDAGVTAPGLVGVTGNSYGGYMAAWLPCVSDVFAASVARSPVTDFRTQHLTSNLAEFDEIFVGGDPFDDDSAYVWRSPLTLHRRIRTPMLLTAGALDLATPASQARVLHSALLAAGTTTELVIYPEEGHGVRRPDAIVDQIARMILWFETYLTADTVTGGPQ
jgi:dipeptidyl aminopeptidase/acylaminoacyl peptidase